MSNVTINITIQTLNVGAGQPSVGLLGVLPHIIGDAVRRSAEESTNGVSDAPKAPATDAPAADVAASDNAPAEAVAPAEAAPAAPFAPGDTVTVNGRIYTGTATVVDYYASPADGGKPNQPYPQLRASVDRRRFYYNGTDIANGVVTKPGSDNSGTSAVAPATPPTPPTFSAGERVNLAGRLYQGSGQVLAVYPSFSGSQREKRYQAYPQLSVRADNGQRYHYNGDDIRNGVVTKVG